MGHYKAEDARKDERIAVKTTKARKKFLLRLSHQLFKRELLKRDKNVNAAIEKCIDYAEAGQKEFGWGEVIDG